jgi:hypothetical protein
MLRWLRVCYNHLARKGIFRFNREPGGLALWRGDIPVSRLIKTDGVGKQRDRLMKAITFALRDLAARQNVDDETRDYVAFMALALREISETIDVTCAAWEKRDYWLKADQFRREWEWASATADKLESIVLQNQWPTMPVVMMDLSKHLAKVVAALREKRGLEKKYAVRR